MLPQANSFRARKKIMEKLGVAMLGLDHWYSADHIAPAVINGADTRLVAVSHDDVAKGRQLIRNADDAFWTSDYRAALDRKDVDIVVLLYSTDRNVAICKEAAALGKHIVSVKPMALDLAGADAIVAAVRAAGVQFFPLESQRRLNPDHRRIKSWLDEGRIGRPLRFTQMLHGSLPMAWPGSSETGWWTDPDRVPGGAWLDHSNGPGAGSRRTRRRVLGTSTAAPTANRRRRSDPAQRPCDP